eukprot:jgi/Bigna1/78958/fgenesh1_pg.58_\
MPTPLLIIAALCSFGNAKDWTTNSSLRTMAEQRKRVPMKMYEVNLDLPPSQRWDHVAKDFKQYVPAATEYLYSFIPKWALPLFEEVAKDVEPYFGDEYGGEMRGLSQALGMKLGDIVVMNLVYQVESLGLNCSNWNNTGPTQKDDPGCMAVDRDQKWCYCRENAEHIRSIDGWLRVGDTPSFKSAFFGTSQGPKGLCTSIVAKDLQGNIFHGRNLDWNLPEAVLNLAIDVNFTKSTGDGNQRSSFLGSTLVGFVGVLHGMRTGRYSVSLDARGKGGRPIPNIMEALLKHGHTPSQHIRSTLSSGDHSFERAVTDLATGPLINEAYFIVGGVGGEEGAVIARNRAGAQDIWRLNASTFYRVETNYDHWNPVPVSDDRRTPAVKGMEAIGREGVGVEGLLEVLQQWPVYNHHTDYTGVFAAWNGTYQSWTWRLAA